LLLDLLEVPNDRRFSALEVLRRGPVDRTGKALVVALARVAGIGLGEVDLGVVPPRRVVDLARRGMTSNATDLRRTMPYLKRLATLLATVVYLETKITDDALELFDVIMTSELLARAERQSNAVKLSRYARLGKDASRLASAVSVLLAADEWDANHHTSMCCGTRSRMWPPARSCVPQWPTSTRSCPLILILILIRTVSGGRR
jgi:hypothetical protein